MRDHSNNKKLKRSGTDFTLLCCQLLSSYSTDDDLQFHFKSEFLLHPEE